MIPRNVISCWFGRGAKTDLFEHCMETQREIADDYEHITVDEDVLGSFAPELLHSPYIKGVLERGEFVKATELGRIWGLWHFGGIYMDCDVELLRRPDPLLRDSFFIGQEDDEWLNGAVMGSVAGGTIVEHLLGAFPFHTDGRLGAHTYGPTYLTRAIRAIPAESFAAAGGVIHPPEVFFPSHWRTPEDFRPTAKTIAHHRWAKSWVGKY